MGGVAAANEQTSEQAGSDPGNLVAVCPRCHLLFGHLGCWASWNPDVREDVSTWKRKFRNRP